MVLGLNDERKKSKERDRSPLKSYNNSPDITKTGDKKNIRTIEMTPRESPENKKSL
jgi:hypothetical protein